MAGCDCVTDELSSDLTSQFKRRLDFEISAMLWLHALILAQHMLTLNKSTSIERISSLFSIPVIVKLLGFFFLIQGTSALYKLIKFIWRENISNPLADLPGPPSPNWLYGNMRQIGNDDSVMHERWTSEYGNTIKYKVFLGVSVLLVSLHTCQPILPRRRWDWLR